MSNMVRLAAVQESSVWLDRDATTRKAISLISEAAANGANVIALPECFIPGFPYWVFTRSLRDGLHWHRRLHDEAVEIPSETIELLASTTSRLGVYVVVGVTERRPGNVGTLFNTNLVFGPSGFIGKHQKLVPTWTERVIWTGGDGSTLVTFPTEYGPLGTLNCGENVNTLARFALLAQGERIHVANFPSCAPLGGLHENPNESYLPAAAHAYEGRLFNIVSSEFGTPELCETLGVEFNPDAWNCTSGIIGPDGDWITSIRDEPGIAYADCDLDVTVNERLFHDITGHYNRFDVLKFGINRQENVPLAPSNHAVPAGDSRGSLNVEP